MLEQYPEDVKLVFKHFPLGNHKFAAQAAITTMAANAQGRFWELHDLIFANYNSLSNEKILELAVEAGLDMARLDSDLKQQDSRFISLVQRDLREGQMIGVRGTPTIFVNGRLLKDRSLQGFKSVIDRELAKSK